MVPAILRNESYPAVINHFSYQEYLFVRGVLAMAAKPVRRDAFKGIRTMYTDDVIEQAAAFYQDAGATPRAPVVMYNPDSATRYNMLPLVNQVPLLEATRQKDEGRYYHPAGGRAHRGRHREHPPRCPAGRAPFQGPHHSQDHEPGDVLGAD